MAPMSNLTIITFFFDGQPYAGRSGANIPIPRVLETVRVKDLIGRVTKVEYDFTSSLADPRCAVIVYCDT